MIKTKAIVTGCNELGLSIIRSLGRKGIPVIALYSGGEDIGQYSRYAHQKVKVPCQRSNPKEFLAFLLKKGKEWKGSLLIPNGDDAIEILSKNKRLLSKYYVVAVMQWDVIKKLLDKKETYALAKKLNIPIPKTFYPNSLRYLEKHKKEFVYPCILKPFQTHKFFVHFNQKLFEVNNFEELKARFRQVQRKKVRVMVSEIIQGADDCVFEISFCINKDGDLLACFLARKSRQNPPRYGIARVVRSIDMIPVLKRRTEKILKKVFYQGICNVEFKKDALTGEYKLLEINSRATSFNTLLEKSGMNLPYVMYMDLIENKKIKIKNYKKEIYWIDIFADITNTLLRRKEENWKLRDYLQPYFKKKKCFAVLASDDLMPFIMKILLYFKKIFSFFIGKRKIRKRIY